MEQEEQNKQEPMSSMDTHPADWETEEAAKARHAELARERTARLNALGLTARGKPKADRPRNRSSYEYQKRYQDNYNKKQKAARERLGLTIREFMKLPSATRLKELNYPNKPVVTDKGASAKDKIRASKREWYRQNKDKVMAARRAKASNGVAPSARYQINECPSCGCPIRVLQVALQFEEDRKHGVQ